MPKLIKVGLSIGLQGCRITDQIEVEDSATPEEIETEVREWALGHLDWWHDA